MTDEIPRSKIVFSRTITDMNKPKENSFHITLESKEESLDQLIKKASKFIDREEKKING